MKKQFRLASATFAMGLALAACGGDNASTSSAPQEVVALKVLDQNGGADLWLTYSKTLGFRFNTVKDGMLYRTGRVQQAQSADMAESSNPFADLAGGGESSGGGSALTFSGSTDAGSSFSGGTDAGSGFSGSTGGSSGFSGSVGGASAFSAALSVPIGLACDATVLCDFFGGMCAGDPSCSAQVDMCREQINSAPIPAELAPFVCIIIEVLECVIDNIDLAAMSSGGDPSPADQAAIMECASGLTALGMSAEDLFGGGDSSSSDQMP